MGTKFIALKQNSTKLSCGNINHDVNLYYNFIIDLYKNFIHLLFIKMASKTQDFRNTFKKTVSQDTIRTYCTLARNFHGWAVEQKSFTEDQKEAVKKWKI